MVLDNLFSKTEHSSHHHTIHLFGQTMVLDMPIPALILAVVGAVYSINILVSWLTFLAETFVFSGISLKKFGAGKNKWAIVTGSTSGIGEEFAYQLAKKGFNIALVSRTQSSLDKVASEIESRYNRKTITFAVDFSEPGVTRSEGFQKIEKFTKENSVGVLINNAGASHEAPIYFAEASLEEISNIIQVNVLATVELTRVVLPNLPSPALILNVGSMSSTVPSPLLATYAASKAFLTMWTTCISEEVKNKGIIIRLINPAFVATKMSKIRKTSALVPSPAQYVKATLSSIGLKRGAVGNGRIAESNPWWSHAIVDWVLHRFNLMSWGIWYSGKMHVDIRRRVLKKRAREAAAQKKE